MKFKEVLEVLKKNAEGDYEDQPSFRDRTRLKINKLVNWKWKVKKYDTRGFGMDHDPLEDDWADWLLSKVNVETHKIGNGGSFNQIMLNKKYVKSERDAQKIAKDLNSGKLTKDKLMLKHWGHKDGGSNF